MAWEDACGTQPPWAFARLVALTQFNLDPNSSILVLHPCTREGAWSRISPSLVGGAWTDQRRWPARPHPKLQRFSLIGRIFKSLVGADLGEGWWGVILTFHSCTNGLP